MNEMSYQVQRVRILDFDINALFILGLKPTENRFWVFPADAEPETHVSILGMLDRANAPVLMVFDSVQSGTNLPDVQILNQEAQTLTILTVAVPGPADMVDAQHRLVSTGLMVSTWFNLDDQIIYHDEVGAAPKGSNDA